MSKKPRRVKRSRRKIKIKNFLLGRGHELYDLVEDVGMHKTNITYPQLLELLAYLRKQWSKLYSIRTSKKKLPKSIGLVRSNVKSDVVPIVDTWVKGQRVTNLYVNGGAQLCVMIENLIHKLRLEVDTPSQSKVKLSLNVLGLIVI